LVIKHKGLIDEATPSTMTPEDIIENLDTALAVAGAMDRQQGKLKLVIGRLLTLASEKPESYTGLGFATFEEFIKGHVMVRYNISRPNIFECKKLYKAWGAAVTVEQYETIPITNLLYAASFTNQGESNHKKVLDLALTKPVAEFQQICEDKGWITRDEGAGAVYTFKGSKAKIKRLIGWLKDPGMQGKDKDGVIDPEKGAGTDNPLDMALAAFESVSSEWLQENPTKRKTKAA
jgi:hypothetical protein